MLHVEAGTCKLRSDTALVTPITFSLLHRHCQSTQHHAAYRRFTNVMHCCFFPKMNDVATDISSQVQCNGASSDRPKSVLNGTHNGTWRPNLQNGAANVTSPLTPSPRLSPGSWQRPAHSTSTDAPASTSCGEERDTCLRWVVNIREWNPWDDEWCFLLDLLPAEDQKEVEAFKFKDDQKRAIISRLLQRHCVSVALGIPWEKVTIKRTKGRKPFVTNKGLDKSRAPNFNFNVSHEGDYVVLASEPICICGVDVAAPQQLRMRGKQRMSVAELKAIFAKQFTPYEWEAIEGAGGTSEAKEGVFRRHWSLKEAFVKARGDGLGFDLSKAEFHFEAGNSTAVVWIEGQPQARWRFFLQELSNGHWVSVARGPPDNIVDAWQEFTGTLEQPVIPAPKFQEALVAPNPQFVDQRVVDIIPQRLRSAYEDACGNA